MTPPARQAWLLPSAMAASLAIYATLHSPLRDRVAALLLGRTTHTGYFTHGSHLAFASDADAIVALVAIVAAAGGAAYSADHAGGRRFEWPLVFGVVAFGLVVIPAAFLGGLGSLLHVPLLRPPVGPAIVALPAVVLLLYGLYRGWRPAPPGLPRLHGAAAPIGALACALLLASAAISMLQPPTGFDALAYHGPLSVYVWRDGDLSSFMSYSRAPFALALPASAELWFGLLLIGGGERLANVGQFPFALMSACAVYAVARRLGARTASAALAASGWLLAPIVVLQAGVQLNDVIAASMLLAAAALASAPIREWTPARCAIIGLATGLALATKVAIVPAATGLGLFCAVQLISARRAVSVARLGTVMLLATAVCVAPWWIRNVARFGNPLYPAAIPLLGGGMPIADADRRDDWFVPARAAWPMYPWLEPVSEQSGFGAVAIVGVLPGLLVALRRRPARPPAVLFAVVAGFSLSTWWLLTWHEPRHLLPAAGLAFAFLPQALALGSRRTRTMTLAVTGAAALFTAVAVLDQSLLPRARQPLERLRFYDLVWNIDPVVAQTPEREPLLYNTGYANLSYAGDYPLLGPALGRRVFTVDRDASTDEIVRFMLDSGLRYAYVPVAEGERVAVEAKYAASAFELEHASEVTDGTRAGTRRHLYRLREQVAVR